MAQACVFCELASDSHGVFLTSRRCMAVFDNFPVSRGHTLITSKRHVESLFDLTEEEIVDVFDLLKRVRKRLDEEFAPDGYNIGINNGKAAGQTISHLHIHVIPRYIGDVTYPQGGIRNMMPNLVPYNPPAHRD